MGGPFLVRHGDQSPDDQERRRGRECQRRLQRRVEALWSHAITPFWDLQLGARRDFGTGPKRNCGAGIEGMLPYRIELEATGYVGHPGARRWG